VATIQWVVNAYTLYLSAFLLVGGAAGDQLGRRRIPSPALPCSPSPPSDAACLRT
jgi:MFS family permease